MAITKYAVVVANDVDQLERSVLWYATGLDSYVPYGPAVFSQELRSYVQTMVVGGVADSVGNIAAADLTNATAVGIALITAVDEAAGRTAIDALASTGVAVTATALATGRTFSATGGATGTSAAFTGAANASIPLVLATPTVAVRGGVLMQPAIADSLAAPTMAEFNALLAALRTADILTP